MRDNSTQIGTGFGEHFHSNEGSQFIENSFSIDNKTIYLYFN